MKLHSPGFEKALRKSVKSTVRSSRELKREYRRVRRYSRKRNFGWIFRPVLALILGSTVLFVTTTTGHLATGLAVINLWLFAALAFQTQGIWTRLYSSSDMAALTLLPVTREKMFRWQLQKYFRTSLWTLFDLLVAFGVLAYIGNFPAYKWVGAFFVAALAWAALLSLVGFCAARLPRWPFHFISIGMLLIGAILFFGRSIIGAIALKVVDQAAPGLNILLPTGWPVSLFQTLPVNHQWWTLALLFPIIAILLTAKDSLKRLFANLQYHEHLQSEPSDLVPGEEPAPISPDKPYQLGPTAIEEIIQSRKFLELPPWPKLGWMEQRLWRWFGRREKVLSEFVFPNGMAITAPWIKIFRNLLITAAVAFGIGFISVTGKFCILGVGLFLTICQSLVQILNQGGAFQSRWGSGVNIPMYAGFGIGIRELSVFLFKCSIIQTPMLLAFTTAAGMISAFLAGFPMLMGMNFGLKFGCLLFASRFIFVTFAFSSGTNDNTKFRSVVLVILIVLLCMAFFGLAGTGLFFPDQPTAWILCAGAVVDAYIFFWAYKWFYNMGRFDLMSFPKR